MVLSNRVSEETEGFFTANVVIDYKGNVDYYPIGLFTSTCRMNVQYFPFDIQICKLVFNTWTNANDTVDLELLCPDDKVKDECMQETISYTENGVWHLRGVDAKKTGGVYAKITFTITIQRRAMYYVFNLIVPCIIVSIIAIFVFVLPPDAGEKIGLGITVLLTITMFLLLVADKLPQTSFHIPIISIYFACIIFMSSVSVMCTVLVLYCHHTGGDVPMHPWVRKYVNGYLARIVLLPKQDFCDHAEQLAEDGAGEHKPVPTSEPTKDVVGAEPKSTMEKTLEGLLNEFKKVTNKMKHDAEEELVNAEWTFAARVIDRLCLIGCVIFTIIATIYLFGAGLSNY